MPGEIVPAEGFYDYEDKYLNDRAKLQMPAPAGGGGGAPRCRRLAVRAFAALRVEGMARVDFFYAGGRVLGERGEHHPGFTPISMYPKLWEVSGLPPARLLDTLVRLAFERHRRRAAHRVVR